MRFLAELDRRLQLGPAMRVQRVVEAALLLIAIFSADLRFAYAALALTILQAISPRLALIGLAASAFVRAPSQHRLGDLYFDLAGSRGACFVSALVQGVGLAIAVRGHDAIARLVLAVPAASFLLSPTLGFCAGCWFYVLGRDVLARLGFASATVTGACDVRIDP